MSATPLSDWERIDIALHSFRHSVESGKVPPRLAAVEAEELAMDVVEKSGGDPTGGENRGDFRLLPQMDRFERLLLLKALRVTRGNRTKAAELLGVSVRTLHYRLKYHGIVRRDT